MRLVRRIFGGGDSGAKRGGAGHACARFEKSILLGISGDGISGSGVSGYGAAGDGVSGDLAEGAARKLERHLAGCAECRESLARSRALREQCLEVASRRRYTRPSIWPSIATAIEEAPGPQPALAPLAWRGSSRRRIMAGTALSLAAAALALCLLTPAGIERLGGPEPAGRTVLDSRWSKEWDEFVTGSEPRGDINIDPFAPEIPNPEVIDF